MPCLTRSSTKLLSLTIILVVCFFTPVFGQDLSRDKTNAWSEDVLSRRMANRRLAETWVQKCELTRMLVDYAPGHVHVSGVDPEVAAKQKKNRIGITEKDLDEFQKHGVDRIVVHGGIWSLCGSFEPFDRDDLRRVREGCRQRGIDFLLYVSTGYLDRRSKAYAELGADESWTQPGWRARSKYTHFAQGALWDCVSGCVGSAKWRSWFLTSLAETLDEWDLDGIYIDPGQYHIRAGRTCGKPGHIHPADDFEYVRLLAEVREIVDRHGGGTIILYDKRGLEPGHEKQWQYVDYWLVGERYTLKEIARCVRPDVYTVIWPDTRKMSRDEYLYAVGLPRLQFPIMHLGKLNFPGVSPEERKHWLYYLDLYHQVARPGTEVYLGISENSLIKSMPDSNQGYVSLFANEDIFVVAGNQSDQPITMEFTVPFEDMRNNKVAKTHILEPRSPGIYRWSGETPQSNGSLLSCGASASSSNVGGFNSPDFAIDGDMETSWRYATKPGDTDWLKITLRKSMIVNGLEVFWYNPQLIYTYQISGIQIDGKKLELDHSNNPPFSDEIPSRIFFPETNLASIEFSLLAGGPEGEPIGIREVQILSPKEKE